MIGSPLFEYEPMTETVRETFVVRPAGKYAQMTDAEILATIEARQEQATLARLFDDVMSDGLLRYGPQFRIGLTLADWSLYKQQWSVATQGI